MENSFNQLLLSTAYLPPIEYFAHLVKYPQVLVEQYETYPKQTYRNRAEIYTEKGRMALSIPVTKINGNRTKTNEIIINNSERWQLNHWRAIDSAYIASPFFLYYKDELFPFFEEPKSGLLSMNTNITVVLCNLIGVDAQIAFSERFETEPENTLDLRSFIHPKKPAVLSHFANYEQVFANRHGFIPNLSIIDLLFNLGPETKSYLDNLISV